MAFAAGRPTLEPVIRVGVTVTFLRMDQPPRDAPPAFPAAAEVRHIADCSVAFYRFLYDGVGAPHLWWLRRTMPDRQLEALLRDPRVAIHVLYLDGKPAGFHELDATSWPAINLSYFGLMPEAVGLGLGYGFLRHAVDMVWRRGARAMTVNTCTADHHRALPTYLRAGFHPVRDVREQWDIPTRLGLVIPEALRI